KSAGSAAGTKPAVAKPGERRQTAKRTTTKGSVSGEKRTAKETAAATRRESISLAGRRKAGQSGFPITIAGGATGRAITKSGRRRKRNAVAGTGSRRRGKRPP